MLSSVALSNACADREHEQPRGVRVHHGLADVVLDRRVVGDAHADVDVALARRVARGDVDRAERDPVPDRRGADQEPRVDGLVVGRRAVALGADDLVARHLDAVDLDRAGLVAAQAERVPQRRLRLDVLAVDHEDREVVVAGEVRARGLDDVEVREAARGRPGRLLVDLVAAVGALGLGGERVPEVRAGLGVGVRQRPELAAVERADVLLDQLGRGAEHERLHRRHVHHVAHRRRRAAVARDRLADHRERDVVLAQPAVLLRHGEREEAVLAHQLEVAARVEQLVVGALRVRAHLLLAQPDEGLAQLLLAVGQDPVRVPVVAQSPEGLRAPHLLRHVPAPLSGRRIGTTREPRSTPARPACPTNGRLTTSVADGTKRAARTNLSIEPVPGPTAEEAERGNCAGRGATAPQGDVVVGRLRRRAREPRLPDRGTRRARSARSAPAARSCSGRSRSAWERCRTTSTPSWRRCSRTSPAASRSTRTRPGASTRPWSVRSPRSATGSAGRSCSRSTGSWPGTLISGRVVLRLDLDARAAAGFDLSLPIVIGIGLIVLVWLFNIYGVRPAVWFGYVTGALLCIPAFVADVPAVHHRRLVELQHRVQHRRERRAGARARVALLHVLVVVRDRGGRDVRAGVPRLAARHAHGAAHRGAVLGDRLRAAAARRWAARSARRRSPPTRR